MKRLRENVRRQDQIGAQMNTGIGLVCYSGSGDTKLKYIIYLYILIKKIARSVTDFVPMSEIKSMLPIMTTLGGKMKLIQIYAQ